jgi:hypothetical protein
MFQPRGIPVKDYGHGCLIGQLPYSMMRDDALFQRSCTSAAECGPSRLNIGWWLGAKEAAPLLLQFEDIGVWQRSKPGWIVPGTDGRHVSLGRSEPSKAEIGSASDALVAQGISAWPAYMQGDYYSREKVLNFFSARVACKILKQNLHSITTRLRIG